MCRFVNDHNPNKEMPGQLWKRLFLIPPPPFFYVESIVECLQAFFELE